MVERAEGLGEVGTGFTSSSFRSLFTVAAEALAGGGERGDFSCFKWQAQLQPGPWALLAEAAVKGWGGGGGGGGEGEGGEGGGGRGGRGREGRGRREGERTGERGGGGNDGERGRREPRGRGVRKTLE